MTTDKLKLYNADCFDIFPSIENESIDLIICDLPYGTTACKWDSMLDLQKLWIQYNRIIKQNGVIVLFGSQPFSSSLIISNIENFKYELIWEKNKPSNIMQARTAFMKYHENILIFSKANICATSKKNMNYFPQGLKESSLMVKSIMKKDGIHGNRQTKKYKMHNTNYPKSILKYDKESNAKHPSAKPYQLIEYLINSFSKEGMTILDNCFGGGVVPLACRNMNRNFIGMEKDVKFFNNTVNRINQSLF